MLNNLTLICFKSGGLPLRELNGLALSGGGAITINLMNIAHFVKE